MGRMKELLHDRMEERKEAWIRAFLRVQADKDLDESSNEYFLAEQAYQDYLDYQEAERYLDEEHDWIEFHKEEFKEQHPHHFIAMNYLAVLEELRSSLGQGGNSMLIKMKFSYSVTVLEACLCEMIKSFVLTDDDFVHNALINIEGFNKEVVTLGVAYKMDANSYRTKVIAYLSAVLYHNIGKVVSIFKAISNTDNSFNIDIAEVSKIMIMRHDVVHRDGKNKEGAPLELDERSVQSAIDCITSFIIQMNEMLSQQIISKKSKILDDRFKETALSWSEPEGE